MRLTSKKYKKIKTKMFLKNNSLILFFIKSDTEKVNEIITNSSNSYFIRNKLVNKLIKQSTQVSLKVLFTGVVFFKIFKKYNLDVTKLRHQPLFLGLKLNNKMYCPKQLTKIKTLNYYSNLKHLVISLNNILIINSFKLKKISK